MASTEKAYSNDELFSSDDASFEANLFREAEAELKERERALCGAQVLSPVYIWVGSCEQSLPSIKQSMAFIHEKINQASGGILDRKGFPVVDEVDAYCILISQMHLVGAMLEPLSPDGYRYPSIEGYHNAFVVPRSMLTDVVKVMTGK